MFYTLISNQGWGMTESPAKAGLWIDRESVIELRSFHEIEAAYRSGCTAFMQRRLELGRAQPVSLPQMRVFFAGGQFFHYDDMRYPPGWDAVGNVRIQRFFAYFSPAGMGIMTSAGMVASALEMYQVPALVLELHSIAKAQEFLLSRCCQLLGAVSAYLVEAIRLPNGASLQPDILYPLPTLQLQQEGQRIWGDAMMHGLPGIDHTPRQVMGFLPGKGHQG